MSFLVPLALVALLVVPAIYLMHLLRGSRRRVRVPALFLWADLPRVPSGRTQRRWPPFSLLLLLQLVAGAVAAFALARPVSPSDPPLHVALVLDASGSMLATDVSPSRFDVARARALERLGGLKSTDIVTVVRAGSEATLLASGPRDSVRSSLQSAQAGSGSAALRDALALASSQIQTTPDRRGEIVLITDLAFAPPEPVGVLAAPVEVVAVGGGSENQAIAALQVRMDPSGRAQTAFVDVVNEAEHAVRVPMRMTGDDAPLDQQDVDLPPRGHVRLSVPLPTDVRRIAVRLLGKDALPQDDTAEAIAPGGPPREVLLSGRAGPSLRRALESIPFVRLRVGEPTGPTDLTVLEATLPPTLPPGPLLLVDPPANSARLLGVGLGSGARVEPTHALLQGLDLGALQTENPSVGGVPGWAKVIFGTLQGPLIIEGRLDGRPTVALTFDPSVSGLDKSLAFPLLISNATSYLLAQAESPAVLQTPSFDRSESDITPRQAPTFASAAQTDPSAGYNERWPWLVAAVIVILSLEWLVFARRG